MEWMERGPGNVGRKERDFKVCDLCGALNPVTNADCFVCGWAGRFHTDRETVEEAMAKLESEYGELTESLFREEVVPSMPLRPSIWSGLWDTVRRLFSRADA